MIERFTTKTNFILYTKQFQGGALVCALINDDLITFKIEIYDKTINIV